MLQDMGVKLSCGLREDGGGVRRDCIGTEWLGGVKV